ncbi:hypothetical protein DFH09DRAFT_1079648 [Mycena vulgaris]|nr:hypothetical protein DFH09DRAFT_1079648 [Mycena vulgaris]
MLRPTVDSVCQTALIKSLLFETDAQPRMVVSESVLRKSKLTTVSVGKLWQESEPRSLQIPVEGSTVQLKSVTQEGCTETAEGAGSRISRVVVLGKVADKWFDYTSPVIIDRSSKTARLGGSSCQAAIPLPSNEARTMPAHRTGHITPLKELVGSRGGPHLLYTSVINRSTPARIETMIHFAIWVVFFKSAHPETCPHAQQPFLPDSFQFHPSE